MFKYDNRNKNAVINKITEHLKQYNGIIISNQSAGRIEYLIKQRQFHIDSIEVSGNETLTNKPMQINIDISKLVNMINQ